jgi:flagella basal body P-ring formation protein FlgA
MKNYKTMIAGSVLFSALLAASTAMALTPASFVKLDGGNLTLGHVFPDVQDQAAFVLAPAPKAGETMVLTSADLNRIARHFNLDWQPSAAAQEIVTIETASRGITKDQLNQALTQELERFNPGQTLDIEMTEKKSDLQIPESAELSFTGTTFDHETGRFTTRLRAGEIEKTITGRAYLVVSVPVLKQPMRADDIIGANDIAYIDVRANNLSSTAIVDAQKLLNMTPKRAVSAMRPVLANDVMAPISVKKGDLVTMTLVQGAMNLTAQGRAMDSGSVGDIVRIINTSSSRVIEGVITAPQTVTIKPAG